MTDENLQRALGRVEGKLDLMLQEQQTASANRKQTYQRLESVDRKVDEAADEIKRVDERLAKVEAPVAEFSKWRERAIGALMLISFVSAATGAAMVAAWKSILAWLNVGN
ncbi:hypothetical protein [uncultured Brevundimonas sp.]|jgi:septal ring factor EnvC (AmiA/AmiB activator)|uniref:hypothetical protein n=1 Tax=uncultured Brevundimonas sp. TaxID=213418 RepID=UPI002638EEB1|nr:hypothetical protein [uncultured Brevundimonas sp.]